MKVENSNYYCVNTKGETVSIPLAEIGLVGRYYNERVLQQYREKDSWTFSYRISKKLATELGIHYWGIGTNCKGKDSHPDVIITAAPVATEIEVANVWNEINYFHNRAYRDTVTRGRAEEFVV